MNKTILLGDHRWTIETDAEGKFNRAYSDSGNVMTDEENWKSTVDRWAKKALDGINISSANMVDSWADEENTDLDVSPQNSNNALKIYDSESKTIKPEGGVVATNLITSETRVYNSIADALANGESIAGLVLNYTDGTSGHYLKGSNNSSASRIGSASNSPLTADSVQPSSDGVSDSKETIEGQQMFDPRLRIAPNYVFGANGQSMIFPSINPYQALESLYFDFVGKAEVGILNPLYDAMKKLGRGEDLTYTATENGNNSSNNTTTYSVKAILKERFGDNAPKFNNPDDYMPAGYNRNSKKLSSTKATRKVVMGTNDPKSTGSQIKKEQSLYGVNAMMNSYAYTRLIGSLDIVERGRDKVRLTENRIFDVRDKKRFYDINIDDSSDVTSVLTPTTTNIIRLGNADKWGRTPYKFQDFVFCKYWNVIPNNRLITLRKYSAPTYDNLNFTGQKNIIDANNPQEQMFAPIATVLTYFGGDSGNTLNSLMTFTTGVNWTESEEGKIWDVTGDDGSNTNELVEDLLLNGRDFGRTGGMKPINSILSGAGELMNKFISFDKFLGFFDQTGYDLNVANADKLFNESKVDPYSNGPYTNRILGPINRINKVYKRKEGIKFNQTLNVKCSYIARPIGNVNTKAALLDILANALLIGSANAVFWGGGYRFKITPYLDPWGGNFGRKNALEQLYKGKIFGKDGGISAIFHGFTKNLQDSTGNFSSSGLKSLFAQGAGFIGEIFNQTIGSLLGISSDGLLDSLGLSSSDTEKGKNKADAFADNVEKLWQSKVIQKTQYPNIQGFHAMLLGEPVGDLHLTVGNPLNPIMVIGNLICDDMKVSFGEELGPDDFPLEMNIEYTLKHGMERDRAAIESMFNRGSGKIYDLPDYIKASSDYETKVDAFTGGTGFRNGEFMDRYQLQNIVRDGASGVSSVAPNVPNTTGYTMKVSKGERPSNSGSADNLLNTKFTPTDVYANRTSAGTPWNGLSATKVNIPQIAFNSMVIKALT